MDITQLRYFLKTAELLNYSQAAESLFITRQSLRQAIANLEGELGAPLFHNERNHLSLSECGAFLALRGREVAEAFDGTWTDTVRLAHRQVTVKVAFSVSLLTFILVGAEQAVKTFQTRFPHLKLESLILPADQVVEAVERGEVDCGCILQMPTPRPGCDTHVLASYQVAVDFGEKFPLCGRETVTPQDLAGVPLVGMGSLEKVAFPLWEDCRRAGITLDYRAMPNTIDAFYHMQHSLCAGLDIYYPEDAVDIPNVKSSLLSGYTWELALLCPQNSPEHRMAELFREFFEAWWRSQAPEG